MSITIHDEAGLKAPRERGPYPSYGPAGANNQERTLDVEIQEARNINSEERDDRHLQKQREISADNTYIPGMDNTADQRDGLKQDIGMFTVSNA